MPNSAPKYGEHRRKAADKARGSYRERGYTHQWDKARKVFLAQHPLCVTCGAAGVVKAANVVDHIIPHRGDMTLFWDVENNWQALCARCHNKKTARGL